MANWVDNFLAHLDAATDGILSVKIGRTTVSARITKDLAEFFKDNKDLLSRVGKETFRSFLLLIHEKKDEQAFNLLLAKMDADDIILRMEINAQEMGKVNKTRSDFLESLKELVLNKLLPTAAKVLAVLLLT